MRDRSEWLEIEVPDLRIVDDGLWEAVQVEIKRRQRTGQEISPAKENRKRQSAVRTDQVQLLRVQLHDQRQGLLSLCGPEGARHLRQQPVGRKGTLENAALSVLQHHLFTEAHARLFVETFNRAVARINGNQVEGNRALKDRLAIVDQELPSLSANMLSGGSLPR